MPVDFQQDEEGLTIVRYEALIHINLDCKPRIAPTAEALVPVTWRSLLPVCSTERRRFHRRSIKWRADPLEPGHRMKTLGDLMFDESEALRFFTRHATVRRQRLTASEAGFMVGIPTSYIRTAMYLGILPFEHLPGGRKQYLLSIDDVEQLDQQYVSTAALAKTRGCSVQTIRAILLSEGIHPLAARTERQTRCCFYPQACLVDLDSRSLARRRARRTKRASASLSPRSAQRLPSNSKPAPARSTITRSAEQLSASDSAAL